MAAPKDQIIPPPPREPVALSTTAQGRIVVLCNDHSLWQRVLDPQNFSGGERFVWQRIEGPPAE